MAMLDPRKKRSGSRRNRSEKDRSTTRRTKKRSGCDRKNKRDNSSSNEAKVTLIERKDEGDRKGLYPERDEEDDEVEVPERLEVRKHR